MRRPMVPISWARPFGGSSRNGNSMARPWERWSERRRPVLTVVGVTAVGLAAEWQSVGFAGPVWIPDLLAGVGLAVAGAVIMTVDHRSRVGDLVALAGLAWFVPNFA